MATINISLPGNKRVIVTLCSSVFGHKGQFSAMKCFLTENILRFEHAFLLELDFKTVSIDCQNFVAQTAALLCCVMWQKNNAAKYIKMFGQHPE